MLDRLSEPVSVAWARRCDADVAPARERLACDCECSEGIFEVCAGDMGRCASCTDGVKWSGVCVDECRYDVVAIGCEMCANAEMRWMDGEVWAGPTGAIMPRYIRL